eukprot:GABV01006767.1.p1 GENE.GABV01006767.1~~GABV01006767.1.p1  ORF type:complete len:117 (-),score=12.71 GABV01006767.1:11-361(-)
MRSQHDGLRPKKDSGCWKCLVCDKTFSRKSNRERHYRTSGHGQAAPLKPFACEACGKRCASQASLRRHLRRCGTESDEFETNEMPLHARRPFAPCLVPRRVSRLLYRPALAVQMLH